MEITRYPGMGLLRQPECEILCYLVDTGVEIGKMQFLNGAVWVISDRNSYYLGESLREAVKDWLTDLGQE